MSGSSGSSGGGRGSSGSPPSTGVALNPKSLLRRHNLPIAAHLHSPSAPPGLDLAKPLLLYSNYTSTKVRAVSLRTSHDGSFQCIGPPLVIPDSYTGWFAVVSNDGRTAPYYTTIEQLVSAHLTFFLTRYDVPAYVQFEDDMGRFNYDRTVIQSGHVLKLLGVYEDLNARRSPFAPRDINNVFSCDKYAQCLNYRNQVVFLPFSASGRFYAPAHKSSKDPSHVYLMTQLLKNYKLPITVRLVCGYMPRVPCSFTGIMRLEKARKEAVILACTMTSEAQATLLEIEVTSNFVLSPILDKLFTKTPIYLKTMSYCQDEGDAWRRQIKVTHHVTENRSRSLTRSLSDKFVEPLTRPLNLSFLADLDKIRGNSKERKKKNSRKESTRWYSHDKNADNGVYTLSGKSFYKRYHKENVKPTPRQNAYILQAPMIQRSLPEEPIEENNYPDYSDSDNDDNGLYNRLSKSVDDIDYCRVLDDISPIPEKSESDDEEILNLTNDLEEEDHYAEISEVVPKSDIEPIIKSQQENNFDKISHVSFGNEDDSDSNQTAQIDFEDDRSLDQISLDMFERDGLLTMQAKSVEDLTTNEIRERSESPSLYKNKKTNSNVITVEAVIHKNNENKGENINNQENEAKRKHGDEVSLISIGNYDIPKSMNGLCKIPELDEKDFGENLNKNYDKEVDQINKDSYNNQNKSSEIVNEIINSVKKNKCILNVSNPSSNIDDNKDFNGNEIKIVLKGNTIVIKVKDNDDESTNNNDVENNNGSREYSKNINITKTILKSNDLNEKVYNYDTEMNVFSQKTNDTDSSDSAIGDKESSCSIDDISEVSKEDNQDKSTTDSTSYSESIGTPDIQEDNDSDTSSLISVSDSGIYFIKLKGFELPESEIGKALSGNSIDCYDSLC